MNWVIGILTAIVGAVATIFSVFQGGKKQALLETKARDAEANAKVEGEKANDAVKAAEAAVAREKEVQVVAAKSADEAVDDLNAMFGGGK